MLNRPVFIGGAPRSGTTLMRAMLDRHPSIACGPEMRVIPALANFSAQTRTLCGNALAVGYGLSGPDLQAAFRGLIEGFLEPYRRQRNKPRIAEKTPANILHFEELAGLFPDADFIHVIRDGRDVVASLLTMDWTDGRTGKPLAMTQDPAAAAAVWAGSVRAGLEAKKTGIRISEVAYEKLIADPKGVMAALFDHLNEPWSEEVLTFYEGAHIRNGIAESSADQIARPLYGHSAGRWRKDLSADAKRAVKQEAGALLKELGYAADDDW